MERRFFRGFGQITKVILILWYGLLGRQDASAHGVPDTTMLHFTRIDSISFEGNRKTKTALLFRELELHVGDSLHPADLALALDRNRLRLLSSGLLTEVKVETRPSNRENGLHIHFAVTETWFVYPVPIFSLADRNFTVWWNEFNRDGSRVNFGLDLTHLNVSGRSDQLKVRVQAGYNHHYELSYRLPPLNRRQTLSLRTGLLYARAHEVAYRSLANKQVFWQDPNTWQLRQFNAFARMTWRPKLYTAHTFAIEYRNNRVSEAVRDLNPDFFLGQAVRQRYASLVYRLTNDHRDLQPYPLEGSFATLEARLNGLLPCDNLHLVRVFGAYHRYVRFGKHWSTEVAAMGRVSLTRNRPPFFNNQALGYGDHFVRGYEYYVSDGLDFGLLKTALRFRLFDRRLGLGKWMPIKAFRTFPFQCLLTASNDLGMSHDPFYQAENPLANRLLWGYGVGFDMVGYYNKIARFEWSRNRLGESGFFVRIQLGI